MRKVIQICGAGGGLFALCEDGSIWNFAGLTWNPVKDLPQPEVPHGTDG